MADTLVLCYHAVSERWPADLSVTPADMERHLEHLRRRGYRAVGFREAVLGSSRGRRVAVTFDDAFASVATLAKPLLDALGWPATVFAVTSFAASGAPLSWDGIDRWERTEHEPELAGMGWERLRGLRDAGWEIGSHTVTHPHLTRLAGGDLARELAASREAVAAALGACDTIAYPYGDVDERVVAATGRAGYAAAAALPARWHAERALEYPRAGVYHPDDLRRFRVKASAAVRRARRTLGR